jgi:hypothetical protein
MMRPYARRSHKPLLPDADKQSHAAEAANNGTKDPEHPALSRDVSFLAHDFGKNANIEISGAGPAIMVTRNTPGWKFGKDTYSMYDT